MYWSQHHSSSSRSRKGASNRYMLFPVHVAFRRGVDQHLHRKLRTASVARKDRHDGGEVAAGAIAFISSAARLAPRCKVIAGAGRRLALGGPAQHHRLVAIGHDD